METIAEVHVFAEKNGIEPLLLEQMIGENFGAHASSISKRMTSGAYAPPKGTTIVEQYLSLINLGLLVYAFPLETADKN